jgi:hypothetical protein
MGDSVGKPFSSPEAGNIPPMKFDDRDKVYRNANQ